MSMNPTPATPTAGDMWIDKPTSPGIWIELYGGGALDIWTVTADELAEWAGGKVCGPVILPATPAGATPATEPPHRCCGHPPRDWTDYACPDADAPQAKVDRRDELRREIRNTFNGTTTSDYRHGNNHAVVVCIWDDEWAACGITPSAGIIKSAPGSKADAIAAATDWLVEQAMNESTRTPCRACNPAGHLPLSTGGSGLCDQCDGKRWVRVIPEPEAASHAE